jgi:hypothetical protein
VKILPLYAAETDALREKLHEAKTPYVVRFQEMVLLSRKLENERDEAINGKSKLKGIYMSAWTQRDSSQKRLR